MLRPVFRRIPILACCLLALGVYAAAAVAAPGSVVLVRFEAAGLPGRIVVEWETATELDVVAFRLLRSTDPAAAYSEIYATPAMDPLGHVYAYVDTDVFAGTLYYYILEAVNLAGEPSRTAPISARAGFDCGEVSEIPRPECNALVALFGATNGPGWIVRTGWLANDTPCVWHGVTCAAGRVQQLVLSNNELEGDLPPALGDLANLEVLDVSWNDLRGTVPPSFGQLASLIRLDLRVNLLSGPLPRTLTGLQLQDFHFDATELCEPGDASFQEWLAGIPNLSRTGEICAFRQQLPLIAVQFQRPYPFWSDRYRVEPGVCTALHWEVPEVRALYLDGQGVPATGSRVVCPSRTATYVLSMVDALGSTTERLLTIVVVAPDPWVGVDAEGNFYRGDPHAPVRMEEFVDFECWYCARHAMQTAPLIDEAYVATGEVVEVFRNFPLLFHQKAIPAAAAAYCAGQQSPGLFWEMHDWLLSHQLDWSASSQAAAWFRRVAIEAGADAGAYDACIASDGPGERIARDVAYGSGRGVWGVPWFVAGECPVIGAEPIAVFEETIEAAKRGVCP